MTEQTDNQQPSLEQYRTCKRCAEVKPITAFAAYRTHKNGEPIEYRRHECIECRRSYQAAWARGEITPRYSTPERACRKCGETKPVDQFAKVYSKKTRGKEYRQHTCIECHREASAAKERRLRATNPERYREANRKHYQANRTAKNAQRRERHYRLRDIVFEGYGGYRCTCCGVTEPTMLTLDHVNNDGAEHRRKEPAARWSKHMYAWLIERGFPSEFQVLCFNCNISKYRNGGVCAHKLKEGSTTIP